MTNVKRLLIVIVAIFFVFAIKVRYGGQFSILLNEPVDFNYSTTNYSDTIFYSFIHENFFYMKKDGAVFSNIFSKFSYDKNKNKLYLEIKNNSSFSNGSPITGKNIHYSLKVFFNRENSVAKKISRSVNKIETKNNRVFITFNYELDNIFQLLSSPELAILSMNENAFSGMLIPDEWERKKYLKLIPNIYYPGGHTYLDRVNVTFDNKSSPDIFLADPGSGFASHIEFKAGIYQNIFLTFPIGDTGKNTRIALYSFLKVFFGKYEFEDINSLTSDRSRLCQLRLHNFQ
ncbi:MAG: hypothetical protein KAS97_13890 [Candidatus Aminicenantes bacterium]|nr:hypothetical protein [Candidatus Aminicenantes bacterium]